jgi:polyisoprenoid-binding protein YceI
MTKLFVTTLIIAPLLGFVGYTAQPLEPISKLWVDGGSTVRNWQCVANKIDAEIATNPQASGVADLVKGATVTIPVGQLDCAGGNKTMNGHMRKALKAETSPEIRFVLKSYAVNSEASELKGTLTIAGVTKDIEIPASIVEQGGMVRVKASEVINMKDYGVKPPSLMMGTMKVKEVVTVGFDVVIKK